MARTIKSYSEHDGVPKLEITSDSLKRIGTPNVSLHILSPVSGFFDMSKTLDIKLMVKEKEPGVKVYGEGKLLKEIDENEFFDNAVSQITSTTRAFYSLPYVKGVVEEAIREVALKFLKDEGTLSAPAELNGFGFILSGKTPIAGIGTLKINEAGFIELQNCVNSFELDKIKDLKILFSIYGHCFKIQPGKDTSCQLKGNLCDYDLDQASITADNDDEMKELFQKADIVYDGKNDEKFAEDVVAFLNSQDSEESDVDFNDIDFD